MIATAPLSGAIDTSPPPVSNQEYALLDHAVRLERNLPGRFALHIHLSRLSEQNRREQQLETARTQFAERVSGFEGQIYRTCTGDIVFVGDDSHAGQIDEAVSRLRAMFSDDPVTQQPDDGPDSGFCNRYFLERDYPQFVALARRLFDIGEARRQEGGQQDYDALPNPFSGVALTPAQLGQLEQSLATTDLSAIMRQQPVCAVTPNEKPETVFHEMYVSIDELGRTLLPGVAIASDPWLFQRLTRTLDGRVLRQIARDQAKTARAFSLNLNVATVLSPEFLNLTNYLGVGRAQALIVELQIGDVFGNLKDFYIARDVAREIGCRLCLDGIDYHALLLLDFASLGFQLYKFQWHDELTYLPAHIGQDLKDAIARAGRERLIMCRAGDETALKFGLQHGISLYQGWHFDKALADRPKARRQPAPAPA